MGKGRIEAFSDGVIAIIITIMVLEMHAPHGASLTDLMPVLPTFLSYVLSFVYVGIYWNNHHHMLHAAQKVNGRALWANMHLLFWLSLIPFTTRWMDGTQLATLPVALYGFVLFMAGVAYYILSCSLVAVHGKGSTLDQSLGKNRKALISIIIYAAAILMAFVQPWISVSLYVLVAGMWFVPDPRFEKHAA